ncbi:MAG TPA: roadblock/LC7 domain-containing protein [Gemmatimonadales bacterium]|nr:roadblock/LC7 domain-containing protein [Gemmatimonadales bacterium]
MSDPTTTPDPRSHRLAFLDLAERLRQRGQLEAAVTVALEGLARHPALPDAHDLVARIRVDQGRDDDARAAWTAVLDLEPEHPGALKGLAYLAFRRHDFDEAERRLETARRTAPRDVTILAALDRVRAARPMQATSVRLDDPAQGLVLADADGLLVAGGLGPELPTGDAAAAMAAGLAREAQRTARFLALGEWRHVVVEGQGGRCVVTPVQGTATLLVRRSAGTPIGRLVADAQRGVEAAARWLEGAS